MRRVNYIASLVSDEKHAIFSKEEIILQAVSGILQVYRAVAADAVLDSRARAARVEIATLQSAARAEEARRRYRRNLLRGCAFGAVALVVVFVGGNVVFKCMESARLRDEQRAREERRLADAQAERERQAADAKERQERRSRQFARLMRLKDGLKSDFAAENILEVVRVGYSDFSRKCGNRQFRLSQEPFDFLDPALLDAIENCAADCLVETQVRQPSGNPEMLDDILDRDALTDICVNEGDAVSDDVEGRIGGQRGSTDDDAAGTVKDLGRGGASAVHQTF